MFIDINIPYPSTLTATFRDDDTVKTLRETVEMVQKLGYRGVAYNLFQTGKLQPNFKNPIQPLSISSDPITGKPFQQFSRITILLEDITQNYGLSSNPQLQTFDIVAVQPTSDKLLQAACVTLDNVDLISLDMSCRLPFMLKHSIVGAAIQRGIMFEITYSASLRDSSARRHLINNAINLIRVTHGKNVILSSSARKAMELRGPYDVINLASLFGLNAHLAKSCLTTNIRKLLLRSHARRKLHRSTVAMVDDVKEGEEWKYGKDGFVEGEDFLSFGDMEVDDDDE